MRSLNKQIIIAVVVLLSIAGISRASFLSQYGTITGTANVSAPEFYIGSASTETLLINEKSSNCAHFSLQATSTRAFITEGDLGGINFSYIPKVRFSIRAKVSATTTPQNLTLRFGYIGNSGPITVCETNVSVKTQMDNYTTDFIKCFAPPVGVKKLFYEFKGNCKGCKYIIGKCAGGFYTKVKLSK